MSAITRLITELIRAANEVGKLDTLQRRRLLDRAVASIREMRDQTGILHSETLTDAVIPIRITASTVERRSDDDVKASMLDAADMIRTLKIILDAKEEVLRGE
jgi:hypothetical protein